MDPQASQLGEEVRAPADFTEAGQMGSLPHGTVDHDADSEEGRVLFPMARLTMMLIQRKSLRRKKWNMRSRTKHLRRAQRKGDALIVVPYDGITRLFEVVIELIPLSIRIYDISMGMMTTGFVTALGAKVGRVLEVGEAVLEVGEAVKDFKRVRVDFALEDSLKYSVQIRVRGRRLMEFMVKYENVPRFYFCWVRFGTELRTSPFKKELGRMLSFHVSTPPVKRGLNFSGSQKERVSSYSGSSSLNADCHENLQQQPLDGRVVGSSTAKCTVIAEVAEDLVHGVQKMAVDVIRPSTNVGSVANGRMQDEMLGVNERVCGIDLYNGSSDGTLSTQEESAKNKGAALPLSLHDRLLLAKSKTGGLPDRKSLVKSPGATKHINKSRKTNKSLKPEVIVQSLKELQSNGKLMGSLLAPMGAGLGSRALEEEKKVAGETQDALKRVAATNNLVGAKDKPHQAQ
uniref:DUF4283 domain-containing protein n=1 Tax=Setaria viridis TaxID=4556 RepID=A0A4U6UX45_SETVI|nr:hypothetical protein SEVIR_4G177100v2 [Setaria viridis]